MKRGNHALWATGLIITSVGLSSGCKHHRCHTAAPCDPFAAQYAQPGAATILPGPDGALAQPAFGDTGVPQLPPEYSLQPQGGAMGTPLPQTYPSQSYPAQTYPAPQTQPAPQTYGPSNGYGAPSTVPGGATPTPALRPHTSPGYQYQQPAQQPHTYPGQPYNGNGHTQSYRPSQYRRYQPQPGSYAAPRVMNTAPSTSRPVHSTYTPGTGTTSTPYGSGGATASPAPIPHVPPTQNVPVIQAPGNFDDDGNYDGSENRSTAAPGQWRAARPQPTTGLAAASGIGSPHVSQRYPIHASAPPAAATATAPSRRVAASQSAGGLHDSRQTPPQRTLPQDPIPLPSR